MNQLEQLKKLTTVVADTGDIEAMRQYRPQEATTNPTLILKASALSQYNELIQSALQWAKQHFISNEAQVHGAVKKLLVNFGAKILECIPGRVSTEIDARLSFDTDASIQQARELTALYREMGIDSNRVLIKIAATWEGIQAAKILEKENIHCNLTLMFNLVQAAACAEAGVTLISPFVGRIYDWYLKNQPSTVTAESDPGVQSVYKIYYYLHHFNYPTTVMGASFRNINQIRALAGCDSLTISPNLLDELEKSNEILPVRLDNQTAQRQSIEKTLADEKNFRWLMNSDPMATEKLAEGIRLFTKDIIELESLFSKMMV